MWSPDRANWLFSLVFVQGDTDCITEITWKFAPNNRQGAHGAYCVILVHLSRALVESSQLLLPCHSLTALFLSLSLSLSIYIYIYIYIRGAFNKFPDIFVQAFNIVVDSWKFSMLLLYILWDDWPIFMISASNEQLQQELEYTLLSQLVNFKNTVWTWGHFKRMICNKILF